VLELPPLMGGRPGSCGLPRTPSRRSSPNAPVLVSVCFCSLLHAELKGKAGKGLFCGVATEPRPLFFGNPASSFHPCFTLRGPLEGVPIFHDRILAQAA
jgi:hypothetical protein